VLVAVQIALGAVHVAHRLHVVIEIDGLKMAPGVTSFRRISPVDLDAFDEIVGRENGVALDVQVPTLYCFPSETMTRMIIHFGLM
jgi:hypothetical protein